MDLATQTNLKALDMLGFSADFTPSELITALQIMAIQKPDRFKKLKASINEVKGLKEQGQESNGNVL